MTTVFYPKEAGWTKEQMLEYINDQRNDGIDKWDDVNEPDPNKLTDELAQRWVDEGYKHIDNAFDSDTADIGGLCANQDDEYLTIALLIQKD